MKLPTWCLFPILENTFWEQKFPNYLLTFFFLMRLQALSKRWVGVNQCVWYKAKKTVQISWEFITWMLTKVKLLTSQSLELSSHMNSFSYIWNTEHILKLLNPSFTFLFHLCNLKHKQNCQLSILLLSAFQRNRFLGRGLLAICQMGQKTPWVSLLQLRKIVSPHAPLCINQLDNWRGRHIVI